MESPIIGTRRQGVLNNVAFFYGMCFALQKFYITLPSSLSCCLPPHPPTPPPRPPPILKFTGRRLVQGEINFLKSTAFADKGRKNQ